MLNSRLPNIITKGHEYVANAVTVVTLAFVTFAFVFVARACGAVDDGDLKSENENKHEVSWL